jgi:lipopolysaccharide transport system permease protein
MTGSASMGAARYWEIALLIAQREFLARFRGNVLGVVTTLAVPLLFLVTYTFVFTHVIPVRIKPGANDGDYAFFLFAGLVGWNLFAETASRAPRLFSGQAHYVRKSLFPTSALALASCLSALGQALLWLAVFGLARAVMGHEIPLSLLAAPLVLCGITAFAAGFSLLMASIGAFVGDLAELISPLLVLWMFVSPVFYPAELLASVTPWLVYVNPMAPQLELLRASLLGGTIELASLASALAWTAAILLLGSLAHARVRPLLADAV